MQIKRTLAFFAVLVMLCATLCGCEELSDILKSNGSVQNSNSWHKNDIAPDSDGCLNIYFIDVGQGDSILMVSPDGKTMLIDSGDSDAYTKIALTLDSLGIESIDTGVITHFHADHIGSYSDVINDYSVGELYVPDVSYNTKTYRELMSLTKEKNISVTNVFADKIPEISWADDVEIDVVSPYSTVDYNNMNDYSIALHVTYGDVSVMLTGDMEAYAERSVLYYTQDNDLQADILKLGHHGSSSSTSKDFFEAVDPRLCVISVGAGNSYKHPHSETLGLLEEHDCDFLRTDEVGTIHIVIDGSDFFVAEQ